MSAETFAMVVAVERLLLYIQLVDDNMLEHIGYVIHDSRGRLTMEMEAVAA